MCLKTHMGCGLWAGGLESRGLGYQPASRAEKRDDGQHVDGVTHMPSPVQRLDEVLLQAALGVVHQEVHDGLGNLGGRMHIV